MEDEKLKVGDVVQLKSGGVKMVINSISEGGNALCVWQVAGQHYDAYYSMSSLKKYLKSEARVRTVSR